MMKDKSISLIKDELVIQAQLLFWYLSMAMDLYLASIEVIKLPIFGGIQWKCMVIWGTYNSALFGLVT